MKKSEIKVGGVYVAKVSNRLVKVRVDSICEKLRGNRYYDGYGVTNLYTGRTAFFRSAAKFRHATCAPPVRGTNECADLPLTTSKSLESA